MITLGAFPLRSEAPCFTKPRLLLFQPFRLVSLSTHLFFFSSHSVFPPSVCLPLLQVSSLSHAGPVRHAPHRDPPPCHCAPHRQTGARAVRQGHVCVSIIRPLVKNSVVLFFFNQFVVIYLLETQPGLQGRMKSNIAISTICAKLPSPHPGLSLS